MLDKDGIIFELDVVKLQPFMKIQFKLAYACKQNVLI